MSEPKTKPVGIQIESLDTIVKSVIEDIKNRGSKPELPTGIPALDEAIWGIHRAEVTIISARPGEGKSTLALQIAKNLADIGKKVLFLSLEMTKEQLTERLLVQFTQVKAWDLRIGDKEAIKDFLRKLEPLHSIFPTLNLRIVDQAGKTIEEVTHIINELEEKGGGAPDVMIIDFVQLIRAEGNNPRHEVIGEYLNRLKEISMKYNMAILVCSQLNREAKKNKGGRPNLANLKGSGSIEELADCVILCWWQELGTEEKPEGTKYWLLIEKQRFGSPGTSIQVNFDNDRLTFHGVEENIKEWSTDGKEKTVPYNPGN